MEIKLIIKHWLHYSFIFFLSLLLIISCDSEKDEAQQIVDKTIEVHGGENYKKVLISFDFRNRKYTTQMNNGKYIYTREFEDSLGTVRDVLDNDGFTRYVNDVEVELTDEWKRKYSKSVNGVIYFALIPFLLNDRAVIKELIGEDTIKSNSYHKVKVKFEEEGGGEDHNDNFIYWIHKDNFTIDYFAYDYETDGGGSRFRIAKNPRREGGILFLDYNNYEPVVESPIEDYHKLFEEGKMKKVSVIELKNIKVEPIGT